MERSKSGSVALILVLLSLAFFAGQSSARSHVNFASLINGEQEQRSGLDAKKRRCDLCRCAMFAVPPCCCVCMDMDMHVCHEGCGNCICDKLGWCYCGDRVDPEQCDSAFPGTGLKETSATAAQTSVK